MFHHVGFEFGFFGCNSGVMNHNSDVWSFQMNEEDTILNSNCFIFFRIHQNNKKIGDDKCPVMPIGPNAPNFSLFSLDKVRP